MAQTQVPVYDSAQQPPVAIAELRDLWQYRFLLSNLVYRDITLRYKRSWLGVFWIMLTPLMMMLVLTVVFNTRFRNEGIAYYPVFLLSGLVIWQVFSETTSSAMRSVQAQAGVLSKIYVPPSVFLVATVTGGFVVNLFQLVPLFVIALVLGVPPSLGWLLAFIPLFQTALFALGVGLLLSTLLVYFDDIANIWEVVLRLGFFISPVFYPISQLGPELADFMQRYNPVVYLLDAMRRAVLEGRLLLMQDVVVTTLVMLVFVLVGWLAFTRVKYAFVYRF